jgi:hypothetical protein
MSNDIERIWRNRLWSTLRHYSGIRWYWLWKQWETLDKLAAFPLEIWTGNVKNNLLTHGAEPFLRSCQLCSHSGTSQHFKEPEGSSPCWQEPYVLVFLVVSFLLAFPPISYMHSLSPPFVLHSLRISSSFWLDHSNYGLWGVQVMKLLVMQFLPISRCQE